MVDDAERARHALVGLVGDGDRYIRNAARVERYAEQLVIVYERRFDERRFLRLDADIRQYIVLGICKDILGAERHRFRGIQHERVVVARAVVEVLDKLDLVIDERRLLVLLRVDEQITLRHMRRVGLQRVSYRDGLGFCRHFERAQRPDRRFFLVIGDSDIVFGCVGDNDVEQFIGRRRVEARRVFARRGHRAVLRRDRRLIGNGVLDIGYYRFDGNYCRFAAISIDAGERLDFLGIVGHLHLDTERDAHRIGADVPIAVGNGDLDRASAEIAGMSFDIEALAVIFE